jgi:hypothetical protein
MRIWSLHPKYLDRDPSRYEQASCLEMPDSDPLFNLVSGEIATWKKSL